MKTPCSPGSSQKLAAQLPGADARSLFDFAASSLDFDRFADTITSIKANGVRSDLIGSIISHFAPNWLPDLSSTSSPTASTSSAATWLNKRHVIEILVELLPPEREAVPCGFVLRLLRAASMAGASAAAAAKLEARAAVMLDRAALQDLMIPSFSHTCGTLLDVGLMLRLVRGFVVNGEARSGAAMLRAAMLVDAYLAEAALDAELTFNELEELARALPAHARANDDGLYRAVDSYIKAHPTSTKQQRKALWGLIDARKLTCEAALHAAQNERLPIRAAIQVLLSEQARLSLSGKWHGGSCTVPGALLDTGPGRVPSKREVFLHEVRELQNDVARLKLQCQAIQDQIDQLSSKRMKKSSTLFRFSSLFRSGTSNEEGYKIGMKQQSPMDIDKEKLTHQKATPPKKWRNSMT